MADKDIWDKAESAAKIVSMLGIPVVLAVVGYFVNAKLEAQKQALELEKLDQQILSKATEVIFLSKERERLFGHDPSLEGRHAYRSHWINTYNEYSTRAPLSNEIISAMMDQSGRDSTNETVTASKKPPQIPILGSAPMPNAPPPTHTGDGWVAVGHFGTKRYADLNFDVPAGSALEDGNIKPGTVLRSRWSVNLRTNTENTEQANRNAIRGVMQAGQCAKVVKTDPKIRGQTWAFVELVTC